MGGLARKATMIDSLSNNNENYLIADAGNLFFEKAYVEPGHSMTKAKIYAQTIIEGFNIIGCDAFSPGSFDFAGGKDFLMQDLYSKASFPFVSINIFDDNDELLFEEYVIKNIDGNSIAFIGVSSSFQSNGINVKDPIESLDNLFLSNDISSDITILLGNLSPQDLTRIYEKEYEIDLIIDSKNGKLSSDGGNKIIPTYSLGKKGQRLYAFDLIYESQNSLFTDLNWCDNTIDYYKGRLISMKEQVASSMGLNNTDLIDLKKHYKNDAPTLKRVNKYLSMIEAANQKLNNTQNSIVMNKYDLGEKGSNKVVPRKDIDSIVSKAILKEKESQHPNMPDHKGRLPGDDHYNHSH